MGVIMITDSFLQLPVDDLKYIVSAVGPRWERLRGRRLLLTGATGFIGKWLLGSFLEANRQFDLDSQVVALSRNPKSFLEKFPDLRNTAGVVWLSGDVRNLYTNAIDDCSFAIHAATDVIATNTPEEILDTCTTGTKRVLDAMKKGTEPRRILILSSGAIYGRIPAEVRAVPENWQGAPDPLDASSAYAEGKRVSELMGIMAAAARPNLEVTIARCFAFVGPHLSFDKQFAIGNFIAAAIRDQNISINGDGTPLRSYMYAADLANWLWTILFDGQNGRAYNVGGTECLSISELAHRVIYNLGGAGVNIAKKTKLGSSPHTYVPDVNRAKNELGLQLHYSLDRSITNTANWALEEMKAKK